MGKKQGGATHASSAFPERPPARAGLEGTVLHSHSVLPSVPLSMGSAKGRTQLLRAWPVLAHLIPTCSPDFQLSLTCHLLACVTHPNPACSRPSSPTRKGFEAVLSRHPTVLKHPAHWPQYDH